MYKEIGEPLKITESISVCPLLGWMPCPDALSGCLVQMVWPDACLVFNVERVIISIVKVLAPMVLKLRPKPLPAKNGYSLRRGRGAP